MNKIIKYGLSLGFAITTFSTVVASEVMLSEQQIKTAKQLISDAQDSELGYQIVESLTTEVGARMAGSEAEQRAREWGQ